MPGCSGEETDTMRFMIIRRADAKTEAGVMPSEAVLSAMGNYNQAMIDAGIFRAGEGLLPTAKGSRISFAGGVPTVTDGPFAETKEVIAGFTMIEVASRAEALAWVNHWPDPDVELELRQVFEMSDFAVDPAETPDGWRAKVQAFRDQTG
jgi:hypothetical protein